MPGMVENTHYTSILEAKEGQWNATSVRATQFYIVSSSLYGKKKGGRATTAMGAQWWGHELRSPAPMWKAVPSHICNQSVPRRQRQRAPCNAGSNVDQDGRRAFEVDLWLLWKRTYACVCTQVCIWQALTDVCLQHTQIKYKCNSIASMFTTNSVEFRKGDFRSVCKVWAQGFSEVTDENHNLRPVLKAQEKLTITINKVAYWIKRHPGVLFITWPKC